MQSTATAAAVAAPGPVAPEPSAPEPFVPEAVLASGNSSELSFYGFARGDVIYDDSRPNALQIPTFILPESPGSKDESSLTMHPRLTRFGINASGPTIDTLGNARISGKLEVDFQNGGRESRAIPRYRHAYLELDWAQSSLLIGQTWDIISPLYPTVNADTMQWNAGNLGDRRMQIRFHRNAGDHLSLTTGLALTGAINSQDLDGNGVSDGEDSGQPNVQMRLGYRADKVSLGLWGHHGKEETEAAIGGSNDFTSYSVGVDFDIGLGAMMRLRGEAWRGSGLGDFRGGIGQSINTVSGEEIDSSGGWIELGVRPSSRYTVTSGFTLDDPDDADIVTGGRTSNRVWYITNQWRPAPQLLLGIDYLNWRTEFRGLNTGTSNRLNLYSVYQF